MRHFNIPRSSIAHPSSIQPNIRKLFEPARTVRTGAQSFLLILNQEDVQ
jgi:hypothetical protein